MRARWLGAASVLTLGGGLLGGGCTFGVNLDGVFAEGSADGAAPGDGGLDSAPPPVLATAIAQGNDFACALRVDGTVTCWGANGGEGRLGDTTDLSSSTPTLVKDVADAVALAAGDAHACVVRKSGAVSCWGYNASGQLGDGTSTSARFPVKVQGVTDAVALALGGGFSCALKKDASVVCWGFNDDGQLGDGTTTKRGLPAPVTGLTDVAEIAAGYETVCARTKTGDVWCWGGNGSGQLGIGSTDKSSPTPKKLTAISGAIALGAGGSAAHHLCAIVGTGGVRCWGQGYSGSLGNGTGQSQNVPVTVGLIDDAVSVATGYSVSCAARRSGAVACWGANDWRQLGVGDTSPPANANTPVPVSGITDGKGIAVGGASACALRGAGRVACWGSDVQGRLGRGTRIFSADPLKLAGMTGITALGLGQSHGCAVSGGALSCWGTNENDQLTGDNAIGASGTPLAVPSLVANVVSTGSGVYHACAVLQDGTAKCWGYGAAGQLGQGSTSSSDAPVTYGASAKALAIGAGYNFTCALLQSGEVECAGYNDNLRLGHGTADSSTPVKVMLDGSTILSGASELGIGHDHACAITNTDVFCWGTSWGGQCGTTTNPAPPTKVALGGAAKHVASGNNHSCAVLQDGSVKCWGVNDDGQLGGSTGGPTPKAVSLSKPAIAIAAARAHSCAALDDGTAWCWGFGRAGELGQGAFANSTTPVQVKGLTTVTALSAQDDSTCAVLKDGSAVCWGENVTGDLGDGSVFVSGTPAYVVGY